MENNDVKVKSRNGVIAFLIVLVIIFAGLFVAATAYILGFEKGNKAGETDTNKETSVETQDVQNVTSTENDNTQKNEEKNNVQKVDGNNTTKTNKDDTTTINTINTGKVKCEKADFYFYAPASWNCTIEKVENSDYKLNSDDEYYEIYGNVNGEKKIAFSIMISSDERYNESSWVYGGQITDGRNIYTMVRFICRDNDGNNYTAADYKFEEEAYKTRDDLIIKYAVKNEFGSADKTKVLEGKCFIRGEAGSSARSYVYYIKDGNLLRISLTDDFKTDLLATHIVALSYTNQKVYAVLGGNNGDEIKLEDDYIVFDVVQ